MKIYEHTTSGEPFWLERHRREFIKSLVAQGYTESSIRCYQCFSIRLCKAAEACDVSPDDLNAELRNELADACLTTGSPYMAKTIRTVTGRFTRYLVEAGVISEVESPPPPPGSVEWLCIELDRWLTIQRGIFGESVSYHRNMLRDLATCCCSDGTLQGLADLAPHAVLDFLGGYTGKVGWRVPILRNILRFLFQGGYVSRDLSNAIPSTAGPRMDGKPRHLEPEIVEKLLEAIRSDHPLDLRNHAMLLLMARLGLRAQEVIKIRLEDIDWRSGRLLICGKMNQFDRMPIPVDIGEAIVTWLRNGRRGNSRHLFTRIHPPFAPFTSSRPVHDALRDAYKRAGLVPPHGQVRTHSLRHSLAMSLIKQGSSLEEIADVLRHRSMKSTTVYARHDARTLRSLARQWPVQGEVQ